MISMVDSNCPLPYGRGSDDGRGSDFCRRRRVLLGLMALGLLLGQHEWGYSQGRDAEAMLPGLTATYSDGKHSVRLVAATPNFYLRPDESIHPSLATAFRAEWTGLLSVLQADDYTIECDSAEIHIAGQRVAARPVRLGVGRHALIIKYSRRPGVAIVRLQWKSALFPLEPIPSSLFFHSPAKTIARKDALVERGRDLVEEFGCVNCHATGPGSLEGRLGPDLTGIGSRTDPRWLYKWLENPSAFRSGAVMPGLFDGQERSDITSYLASLQAGGSADQTRKPARHDIAKGNQFFGVLGCAACHQEQGLGLDGMGSKATISPLAEYLKNPAKYDPGGRMPSLMLSDEEAFQLAAYLVDTRNREFEQPWKPGDPVRGKELVQSEGCLSCHTLDAAQALSNRHRAPPLVKVALARGCLASEPRRGVPNYRLNADRREAIQAFLRNYKLGPDVSHAPVYQLQRSLRKLRCGACHHIDSTVPAATVADAVPPLTDVGAKLRTGWIEQVLVNRQRVWSGLDLRMPHYDSRHVRPMIDAFARASGVQPGEGPGSPSVTALQSSHGIGMIGTDGNKGGMACIGCHDWGAYKSLGEEGPQLINVAARLRYDWYGRWMLNPARILSGTSMPNYFGSMEPKSAKAMIDKLWAALSMGESMPLPDGLKKIEVVDVEARPVPEREAIVVRWDMPEATPAAIAVGLPGGISYCFDAGQSRLRYAWKGGFIDLTDTLRRKVDSNRLTPTAKLVGEIFYRGEEFPLRIGTTERIPERRFRGYRIVEGTPEFHYQVDGVEVYERVVAVPDNQGITRQFTVGRVDQPMWLAAGRGAGVVVSSTIGDAKSGPLLIPRGTNVRFSVTITLEKRSQ